jgi:hypothetical protein
MESAEWGSSGVSGIGSIYKVLVKIPGGKKEGQFEITLICLTLEDPWRIFSGDQGDSKIFMEVGNTV